jgi:hypothetical protein
VIVKLTLSARWAPEETEWMRELGTRERASEHLEASMRSGKTIVSIVRW